MGDMDNEQVESPSFTPEVPPKAPAKPRPMWQKLLVAGLIILGLLFTLAFGMRAMRSFVFLRQRAALRSGMADVEMVRGWMTVPYLSRLYGVPEDVLYESLGGAPENPRRQGLAGINRQRFPGQSGEAVRRVKEAIRLYQAEHPATGPAPGNPVLPGNSTPPGNQAP